MTPTHGTNLLIAISTNGTDWTYIGLAKNCKLKKSRKMIEVSSPTTGDSECYIPGRKSWSMQSDNLYSSETNLDSQYEAGTQLYVQLRDITEDFSTTKKYCYEGRAYIKSLDLTGNLHEMAKYNVALQGTGTLTHKQWTGALIITIASEDTTTGTRCTASLSQAAPCEITLAYNSTQLLTIHKGQTSASTLILMERGQSYSFSKWAVKEQGIANYTISLLQYIPIDDIPSLEL